MTHHSRTTQRRGFTLVELMAVIVIMGILFTLVAFVGPGTSERRAAARAADQLQGWLLQARSKAMRDQAPRGVRMVKGIINSPVTGSTSSYIGVEFIEQPEPFMPRQANGAPYTLQVNSNGNPNSEQTSVLIVNYPFNAAATSIQPNDILELSHGTVSTHSIKRVDPAGAGNSSTLITLYGDQDNPPILRKPGNGVAAAKSGTLSLTNGNWRIIRGVRAIAGEPALYLPKDTVIEPGVPPGMTFAPNVIRGVPSDILFSPTGALVGNTTGKVVMWVRHIEDKGEPTLISVAGRTGSISAHPVDKTTNAQGQIVNPYRFTEDGLSSGL